MTNIEIETLKAQLEQVTKERAIAVSALQRIHAWLSAFPILYKNVNEVFAETINALKKLGENE